MSRILPRFFRRQEAVEDQARVTRNLLESGESAPVQVGWVTLPGDARRLRGIPVVGGVSGTSPGTDPLAAVLASEPRRRVDRWLVRNSRFAPLGDSGTLPTSPLGESLVVPPGRPSTP